MKDVEALFSELLASDQDAWAEFEDTLKVGLYSLIELEQFKSKINAGCAKAPHNTTYQLLKGLALFFGIGASPSPKEGVTYIIAAAEKQNMIANYFAGECSARMSGLPQNLKLAKQFYATAFKLGHRRAGLEWAKAVYRQEDLNEFAELKNTFVELADPQLLYEVGLFCEEDYVSENNLSEALQWYRLGAELGHIDSQCKFASLADTMQLDSLEQKCAVNYLKEAIRSGSAQANYLLGSRIANGKVTSQNLNPAFYYFVEAVLLGYQPAMHQLARCYQYGFGVELNMDLAAQYYFEYFLSTKDPKGLEGIQSIVDSGVKESLHAKAYLFLIYYLGVHHQQQKASAIEIFNHCPSQERIALKKVLFEIMLVQQGAINDSRARLNELMSLLVSHSLTVNFENYNQDKVEQLFTSFINTCEERIKAGVKEQKGYFKLLSHMAACKIVIAQKALNSCLDFKVDLLAKSLQWKEAGKTFYLEQLQYYVDKYGSKKALHEIQKFYIDSANKLCKLAAKGDKKALKNLKSLAKQRSEANIALGRYYMEKAKALSKVKANVLFQRSHYHKKAFECFNEAAFKHGGTSEGLYLLAQCYEKGVHVKKDLRQVMQLCYLAYRKDPKESYLKKLRSFKQLSEPSDKVLAHIYLSVMQCKRKSFVKNRDLKTAYELFPEGFYELLTLVLSSADLDSDDRLSLLSVAVKFKIKEKDQLVKLLEALIIDKIKHATGSVEQYDMVWIKRVHPKTFVSAVLYVLRHQNNFSTSQRTMFLVAAIRIAEKNHLPTDELKEFEPSHTSVRKRLSGSTRIRVDSLFFKPPKGKDAEESNANPHVIDIAYSQ